MELLLTKQAIFCDSVRTRKRSPFLAIHSITITEEG